MPNLTPQQFQAVSLREVSTILSSGAGCGKTHVLTQRYLSHLRHDRAEVNQIVAITFTDRAARQMRERIRAVAVKHLEDATTEEEIVRWESHLRGLETAQISTIHAFCANLLRQFAVEAGLDPRFEVLEDFLAANLERESLTASLQRLLVAKDRTGGDLRELILLYGWRPVVNTVRGLLTEAATQEQDDWLAQTPEEIADAWRDYARSELPPKYVEYLATANSKIAHCINLLRSTPCYGPKMSANVSGVLEGMKELAHTECIAEVVERLIASAKVVGTEKAAAWESQEVYDEVKDALADFRKHIGASLSLFIEEPEDLELAAQTGQRFLRVALSAVHDYREHKKNLGVVDFQDLLVLARNLLRTHRGIRERLQKRYRYLLIDELQDTDPVQMEFVEFLAGVGLTQGKLFAVGDHSQSIYRFRGADVQLFQNLKGRIPYQGRLRLSLNFRSQPAILDFVNLLLKPVLPAAEAGDGIASGTGLEDYEPLASHHTQLNPERCIEFLWSPRARNNATESRQTEAEWIARRIAQMVRGEEKLVAERENGREFLRPVKCGDVVLLFRSMTNVQYYESALRAYGLDYYLVGGRAFFAQQEIYDLLNLLRALENPQDSVSLAGVLRSPFCCLSDEALFVLSRHRDGLWAGLNDKRVANKLSAEQRNPVERARENMNRWRDIKNRIPIAALLGEILSDSAYDAALQFEFLGDRKLANLWKLMDMARSFDRSGLFGLAEFIERLNDLVRTQPKEEQAATLPEQADVIRLMSIHQAKGLEFPLVFIPDIAASVGRPRSEYATLDRRLGCVARPPNETPPPFTRFGWDLWQAGEKIADWREDLRTLYVACTRAQDYLVLSASLPDRIPSDTPWMMLLSERFDLHTGDARPPNTGTSPPVRVTETIPEIADDWKASVAAKTLPQPPELMPWDDRTFSVSSRTRPTEQLTPESPAIPEWQWDVEDGSDLAAWDQNRKTRASGLAESANPPADTR